MKVPEIPGESSQSSPTYQWDSCLVKQRQSVQWGTEGFDGNFRKHGNEEHPDGACVRQLNRA